MGILWMFSPFHSIEACFWPQMLFRAHKRGPILDSPMNILHSGLQKSPYASTGFGCYRIVFTAGS